MNYKFFSVAVLLWILSFPLNLHGQILRPGFDKLEYLELLRISSRFGDSAYRSKIESPLSSRFVYRSPVVGLDNVWELWKQDRGVAVISIRGTTGSSTSWMANFYAAMVPAKGQLQMSKSETWNYELAQSSTAAVHAGWLIAMAFLSKDILPKLDSAYHNGTREFIISGHSQGGAIAYLLTAHLYQLRSTGKIPSDIVFKTYCSAGPKPGNLYFAYEYEDKTKNGWAFNVVNSADWVPETPMSIQTMEDLNPVNPFEDPKKLFSKLKFPQNIAMRFVLNRLDNPTKRARKNYKKYLGNFVGKSVGKKLDGFTPPEYYNSVDYVRTGAQIVLLADDAYYQQFPQDREKIFTHHLHQPYIFLTERYGQQRNADIKMQWVLDSLNWKGKKIKELYASGKPRLYLSQASARIAGTSGCNSFSGNPIIRGNSIDFNIPIISTKKYCPGEGEMIFFEALQSVNRFEIVNNRLIFYRNKEMIMRFAEL
jgi:heat shock protein HslJ